MCPDKIAFGTEHQVGAQRIAHQIIATAFFTGAAVHCYSFTYTVMRYQEGSQLHSAALLFIDSLAQAFVVRWYICGITFGATTTPGSKGICGCNNGDQLRRSRVGAVPNRGLVHFIFGTYSIDLGWYRNRTGIQYKTVATEDMAMTGQPT